MTQLPMEFDPTQVAPSTGAQGQLPVSDSKGHKVVIVSDEMKPTSDNSGTMLVLTLQIVEGPHAGVEGVHRLNIGNQSADAVRIAYSELSAICYVVGWQQRLTDTKVLHNKPFRVVVALQKEADAAAKGFTNVIGIRDANGNKPGQNNGAASAGPAPGPAMPPHGQPPQPPQTAAPAPQPSQPPQGQQQAWQQPQQPQQPQQQQYQQPPQQQYQQPTQDQSQQPMNTGFPPAAAPMAPPAQPPQQYQQPQAPQQAPNPGAAPWNAAPPQQ